jgi:serine/threonine protein phosphatase PrpC
VGLYSGGIGQGTFRWLGSDAAHLDEPCVSACGDVAIGCYGGSTAAGAETNEDAALVWRAAAEGWTLAMLLDAHRTAQSAALVLEAVESARGEIAAALAGPAEEAFPALHRALADRFRDEAFRARCRRARGETACLVCAQKEQYLWWLSVGDCLLYLLHPELAQWGQYALNQRQFYEWIGRVNTFDLAVPCYSTGTRELRRGVSHVALVTDGVLECGDRPFAAPEALYAALTGEGSLQANVRALLQRVRLEGGRDSATIVCWRVDDHGAPCAYPSG